MVPLVLMTINSILGMAILTTIRLRYQWELDAVRTSRPILDLTLASTNVAPLISERMSSLKRTGFIKNSDNFLITTKMSHFMKSQGERLDTSFIREIQFPGKLNVKALYHARMHSHSSQKDFLSLKTQTRFSIGPRGSYH